MGNDYGLALSGGGARGAAHVGILMALAEKGLLPDRIATGAGLLDFGCMEECMKQGHACTMRMMPRIREAIG